MRRSTAAALIATLAILVALAVVALFVLSDDDEGRTRRVAAPAVTPVCTNFTDGRLNIVTQHLTSQKRVEEIVEPLGARILNRIGGRTLSYGPTGPYYSYVTGRSFYTLAVPEGEELTLVPQLEAFPEVVSASVSCHVGINSYD